MIRLTSYTSGKAVSVSPELIKAVIEDENFTYIHFGPDDDYIKVSESREEVARKVLEYRLAMIQYRARFQADANWTANKFLGKDDNYPFLDAAEVKRYIEHLAGLEESK